EGAESSPRPAGDRQQLRYRAVTRVAPRPASWVRVRPAGRVAPRRSTEYRTMTLLPRSLCTITLFSFTLTGPGLAPGGHAGAKGARDRLPVREVTAFKDGHAFVLREGSMQPDADGRVVLEGLPVPVLGTFWPYATGDARVVSATAGRDRVVRQHEAVELR